MDQFQSNTDNRIMVYVNTNHKYFYSGMNTVKIPKSLPTGLAVSGKNVYTFLS